MRLNIVQCKTYSIGGDVASDARPTESMSLTYEDIETVYMPQSKKDGVGAHCEEPTFCVPVEVP